MHLSGFGFTEGWWSELEAFLSPSKIKRQGQTQRTLDIYRWD